MIPRSMLLLILVAKGAERVLPGRKHGSHADEGVYWGLQCYKNHAGRHSTHEGRSSRTARVW